MRPCLTDAQQWKRFVGASVHYWPIPCGLPTVLGLPSCHESNASTCACSYWAGCSGKYWRQEAGGAPWPSGKEDERTNGLPPLLA